MQTLKTLLRTVAAQPLLLRLWRPRARSICILNYHRVVDGRGKKKLFDPNRAISIEVTALERQLKYFKAHHKTISLSEAVASIESGRLPVNGLAVTFDDGYLDNMQVALPLFERYEIPFTVFVTTGLVDRTASLWWEEQRFILERLGHVSLEVAGQSHKWRLSTDEERYRVAGVLRELFKKLPLKEQELALNQLRSQCSERYSYDSDILTWDQLRQFVKHPLVTIGAHTVRHPILALESAEDVENELRQSADRIEQELGKRPEFLAYPIGSAEHADVREFEIAERVGYRAAFTSRAGLINSNDKTRISAIPRLHVDYSDWLTTVAWRAAGL